MMKRIPVLVGAALVTSVIIFFFSLESTPSPAQDVQPGGGLAGRKWDGRGSGNFTEREAEDFDEFDLYWLGPDYQGLNLQRITHTPQSQEVTFIYGSCRIPPGEDGGCAVPLSVRVQPLCKIQPSQFVGNRQLTALRGQALINRGAIDRLRESAMIWTGSSAIIVLPALPDLNLDDILAALRGLGANQIAAGEPLPEPDFLSCGQTR
jgi:hypothetical protein